MPFSSRFQAQLLLQYFFIISPPQYGCNGLCAVNASSLLIVKKNSGSSGLGSKSGNIRTIVTKAYLRTHSLLIDHGLTSRCIKYGRFIIGHPQEFAMGWPITMRKFVDLMRKFARRDWPRHCTLTRVFFCESPALLAMAFQEMTIFISLALVKKFPNLKKLGNRKWDQLLRLVIGQSIANSWGRSIVNRPHC